MKRWLVVGICMFVLGSLAVLAGGCGDSLTKSGGDPSPYAKALTHPDSLLKDLELAYERQEIEPYANLLSKDFVFRFQAGDIVPEFGPDLTFVQDSTFTGNMFGDERILSIQLNMAWDGHDTADWAGEPALRIKLTALLLNINQNNGITLQVSGDSQHFFFRLGKVALGEDPNRYYMMAWRDISGIGKTSDRLAMEITWGSIKKQFGNKPLGTAALEGASWGSLKTRYK